MTKRLDDYDRHHILGRCSDRSFFTCSTATRTSEDMTMEMIMPVKFDLADIGSVLQKGVVALPPGPDGYFQGTAGDDNLVGGSGNDVFVDSSNNSNVNNGNDHMSGGAGNDTFYVGTGNDTIDGGSGLDAVHYEVSDRAAIVDLESGQAIVQGVDRLSSIENVVGTRQDDLIFGSGVANNLNGFDGDDRLDGRGGNDTLDGGFGNDKLSGGADDDILNGGVGDDALDGGSGNDVINGGFGWDHLTGGAGADRFVFSDTDGNDFDTITDFQHGVDKIDLREIDADRTKAGDQSFHFDATPDGKTEEFFDGVSDDFDGIITDHPGPIINGDTAEIETRFEGGYTYVYLSTRDGKNDADFRIEGHVTLTASDFLL